MALVEEVLMKSSTGIVHRVIRFIESDEVHPFKKCKTAVDETFRKLTTHEWAELYEETVCSRCLFGQW